MVALNEMRITPGVSPISVLLNLLWIIFGGLWMAAGWMIAAIIMAITIIGLPWTRAAFNIGVYTLLPFGQKAVSRVEYYGHHDLGTGPLGVLGNVLWLVLAGWWLALLHLFTAIILAITIVGIPFAVRPREARCARAVANREDDRPGLVRRSRAKAHVVWRRIQAARA